LLRKEVKSLAIDLPGESHFKKQEIEHQVKKLPKKSIAVREGLKYLREKKRR
jgi:hypothetical protein